MSEDPTRITVSRDALRADLAEMELRLRFYFDEQLKHKADSAPVIELMRKVDALDRGDFTDVHRRALAEFIEEHTIVQQGATWTRRERLIAVLSVCATITSLMLSVGLALHGVTF